MQLDWRIHFALAKNSSTLACVPLQHNIIISKNIIKIETEIFPLLIGFTCTIKLWHLACNFLQKRGASSPHGMFLLFKHLIFFQENILIRRGVWNVCVWVSIGLVNRHCCILFDVLHQKVAITVCHFLTVNDFYRSIPTGEALFLLFKGNSSWIYGENWMIYLVFFFLGRFHHNHMALLK